MPSSNKTFTVPEVADLLGLSEFTVRRRIKEGKLKAVMDSKKQWNMQVPKILRLALYGKKVLYLAE